MNREMKRPLLRRRLASFAAFVVSVESLAQKFVLNALIADSYKGKIIKCAKYCTTNDNDDR